MLRQTLVEVSLPRFKGNESDVMRERGLSRFAPLPMCGIFLFGRFALPGTSQVLLPYPRVGIFPFLWSNLRSDIAFEFMEDTEHSLSKSVADSRQRYSQVYPP